MPERLAGRVAVVTGASKGIGRAVAKLYATEGAKVLATFQADRKSAEAAEEIEVAGGIVSFLQADVSNKTDTERVAREAMKLYGRIDVLCSNAGVYPAAPLESMTEDEWDRVHAINLKGTFLSVKACLPQMQQQRYGKIVVVASTTGTRTGLPGYSHYGATKAGILGFIRCACLEVAKHNVTINAVCPGVVMTEGVREAFGSDTDELVKELRKEIPLGRLGNPSDVAYAALFFASDESNYITGQELIVDGGLILPEVPLRLLGY